jgi:hypothetical protein
MKTFIIISSFLMSSAVMLFAQENKIIFIMSGAKEMQLKNGKIYTQTGVLLSEMYLAYKEIEKCRNTIDFATPNSVTRSIDKKSLKSEYWSGRDSLIVEAQNFAAQNS